MPTNEERKAVAARLREHQYGDVRASTYEDGMIASWWRLKDALGTEGDDPQEDHTMMFGYLADLIEPEPERTCRIKQHRCTNCDHEINDRAYFVKVELFDGCWKIDSHTANYCPNCGTKVVE